MFGYRLEGLRDYVEISKVLSPREKECLIFFLKGYSAKETVSALTGDSNALKVLFLQH